MTDPVNGEGLELTDLITMMADNIDDLVEAVRKPGGTVPNP